MQRVLLEWPMEIKDTATPLHVSCLLHPLCLSVADVITRKSTEVKDGLDLYIATEYASG